MSTRSESALADAVNVNRIRHREFEHRRREADRVYAERLAMLDRELGELQAQCPHRELAPGDAAEAATCRACGKAVAE